MGIRLIVGLGNPGRQYAYTRHNIGYLAIDAIAEMAGISVSKIKFKGLWGKGRIAGKEVYLLKPETYMNLSGESVREMAHYFKIDPEEILVIVDDIDIDFGDVRIRKKGSAGTHNGLKSIIYQLQDDTFPRIKIGVGKPKEQMDLADFVLGGFSQEEGRVMEACLKRVCDIVTCVMKEDLDKAMNRYNKKSVFEEI